MNAAVGRECAWLFKDSDGVMQKAVWEGGLRLIMGVMHLGGVE
jgi:hypothetical protein